MTVPTVGLDFMPGAGPFDVPGDFYLNLPGANGDRASTPDNAALDITGDIFVAIDMTLDPEWWIHGNTVDVIAKAASAQVSWRFLLQHDGRLNFLHSSNGTTVKSTQSTTNPVVPNSGRLAIAAWLDVDNGASGHTVTFYTATSIAGPWTVFSTVTTSGTSSIFSGTADLQIGDCDGFSILAGRVHAAQVRSGNSTGTIVANPNFAGQTAGTTSFTDSAGRLWSLAGGASIRGFNWTAISASKVLEAEWSIGRSNELDRFNPGTASIVLDNADRLFDPEHASGTYYGKLLPRVPFRLRLDPGTGMVDRFYGFVQGGFKPEYHPPSWATCNVTLLDMQGVLDGAPLAKTALDSVVLNAEPLVFWKLEESAGTQMADASGNGYHGERQDVESGDGIVIGSPRSMEVAGTRGAGIFKGTTLPTGPPASIEAWIKTDRDLTKQKAIAIVQRDSTSSTGLVLEIETSAGGSPNGELVVHFVGLGGAYKARGHTRIDDGVPHHVVFTMDSTSSADILLYVDGIPQTKTTISGTTGGSWPNHYWWSIGNTVKKGNFGLDGLVGQVAIYSRVLSATEIVEHYDAGATAFSGESSGARITRILDAINFPTAFRDIGTGDTFVGQFEPGAQSAGSAIAKVVESEQGYFYVDHRNGGMLKFRGRYERLTASRSTTSQATFTNTRPVPGGEYKYKANIEVEPNGADTVINEVEVTWQGGTEVVSDEASLEQYGPGRRNLNTDAPTPSAARSAGLWLVARHGQPQTRVRGFEVNPGADTSLWTPVLALRIGDRITIKRHPQLVGSQITNAVIIEGQRERLSRAVEWMAAYSLSDADDTAVWIWGTSAWGEDTYWG